MVALEIEEAESLVSSSVGIGNKRDAPPSAMDAVLHIACEPKNRMRALTMAFMVAMLLVIVAANAGSFGNVANDLEDEPEIIYIDPMETIPVLLPVTEPPKAGVIVSTIPDTPPPPPPAHEPTKGPQQEPTKGPQHEPTQGPQMPVAEESKVDIKQAPTQGPYELPTEDPKQETKQESSQGSNELSPEELKQEIKVDTKEVSEKGSKIPFVELDIQTGRSDESVRVEESKKWGSWHFWDGESSNRPKDDYCSKYPNRDIPGDDFPDNSWQLDAVYVNHYLNDADKLVQRAMEAIFTEYGKGKPLASEKLAERHRMFHWENLDFSKSQDPPKEFKSNGSRDIGGWTTKRSFDGLVRRLLHAMLTEDTFTVVLAGHSASQGQGNHFRQSYMMQFHRVLKPIFERLGIKLITRNISFGGLGTIHSSLGSRDILGKEIDLILWDSGMTENGAQHHIDLFFRQALISGNRVPILWASGPFDLLKMLHENVDADVGEWGNGFVGIDTVHDEIQALEIPWAARYIKCVDERKDLCKDNRFRSTCWINRTDHIFPEKAQRGKLEGQVKWHPGWRVHQLQGRVLAFAVLEALEVAINRWSEGTRTGQPLDDDYWHVTTYFDNIRNKVKNLDPAMGHCHKINGTLPLRLCNTRMNGRTQYTPRADFDESSLTSIIKPADNGYVPRNDLKNLYDGPDAHNPNFDIPEGEIDVASIVSNRRTLTTRHFYDDNPGESSIAALRDSSVISSTTRLVQDRRLDDAIIPGKGWEVFDEPQGLCDGTYEAQCGHSTNNDCFLSGHHCSRGAVIGNEWSGWLVMTLKDLVAGIIVIKLHTWHYPQEQVMTANWDSVNGERRRIGHGDKISSQKRSIVTSDASFPVTDCSDSNVRRSLTRKYDTPALPDTFMFDYAINGVITSLNATEFLAQKREISRVVETWTLLDNPDFTNDPQDVEVAIRLRGSGRQVVFGVSHIYWG